MATVAFTASRVVPPASEHLLRHVVKDLVWRYDLFVTGACIGGDQKISDLIEEMRPGAPQRIIVPRDLSRVDEAWLLSISEREGTEVLEMPRGTTYRDRNLALLGVPGVHPAVLHPVNACFGFPLYRESDERSVRSGTWQTLRLARGMGISEGAVILS